MQIQVQHDWQIQVMAVASFHIIYGARMNILFIFKLAVFELIRWSYRSYLLYPLRSFDIPRAFPSRSFGFTHKGVITNLGHTKICVKVSGP
jgi:hypothetical protein